MRGLASLVLIALLPVSSACGGGKVENLPDGATGKDAAPADGAVDAGPKDECRLGEISCTDDLTIAKCATVDGQRKFVSDKACPPRTVCEDGVCGTCLGYPGYFFGGSIKSDDEDRFSTKQTPENYTPTNTCPTEGYPLWIHFHDASSAIWPEIAVNLDVMREMANERGMILLLPRARPSTFQGKTQYSWDGNVGDLARNVAFVKKLVANTRKDLRVDAERVYISGVGNGANMAAQFMNEWSETQPRPAGFGFLGGGMANIPEDLDLEYQTPRVYVVQAHRSNLVGDVDSLLAVLDDRGLPAANLWKRQTDTGADYYTWQLREMFDFLMDGTRTESASLGAAWTRETFPAKSDLLALAENGDGHLVASAADGIFYKRNLSTGKWSAISQVTGPTPIHVTDLCFWPSGKGLAVAGKQTFTTANNGTSWTVLDPAVAEFQGAFLGSSYLNSVQCDGATEALAGGYWTGVKSSDSGATWSGEAMTDKDPDNDDFPARVGAVFTGPSGVSVAVGAHGYVGRRAVAGAFVRKQVADMATDAQWLNDISAAADGRWWVAGDHGAIYRSIDDMATPPIRQQTNTTEDFYAVSFVSKTVGIAVGNHGAALLTTTGGDTWTTVNTGLDIYLGDVVWLDPEHAIVVGEGGTVLRFDLTAVVN